MPRTPAPTPAPPEQLWSVDEVSFYTRIPVQTIYKWRVTNDGPPAYRLGKHLRFDPAEVRAWVRDQNGAS